MNYSYDYQSSRERFLELAESFGGQLQRHVHPLAGPDGELALDVARFGNLDSSQALVLSSGTHGIEGYCGSFIQCELLGNGIIDRLPDDLCLVLVHGVNPHGFAWKRRVNEDNIDLNRNFGDYDDARNTGYQEIAEILEPTEWTADSTERMWQQIFEVAEKHAHEPGWQGAAITSGQYSFPNGVFYGGTEPAWSNLKIREVAKSLVGKQVVWLDIHTALGPYGEAECIVEYMPGTKPLTRSQELWGSRVKNTKTNESASADVSGSISVGTHGELGDALVMAGLEYGTVKPRQVLEAVIGDQWLHRYGDLDSDLGREMKQRMMDAFYPDDPAWRASVYKLALEVIEPLLGTGAN